MLTEPMPYPVSDTFGATLSRPPGTELIPAVALNIADARSIAGECGESSADQAAPNPAAATPQPPEPVDTFTKIWVGSSVFGFIAVSLYAWLR